MVAALPRRKKLFESIESDGMELEAIEETPLDDMHTLVRTAWNLRLPRVSGRSPVTLLFTFF